MSLHLLAASPEALARRFHETYERLAPDFGYRTREASAKPWAEVPEQNKALMVATAAALLAESSKPAHLEARRLRSTYELVLLEP